MVQLFYFQAVRDQEHFAAVLEAREPTENCTAQQSTHCILQRFEHLDEHTAISYSATQV